MTEREKIISLAIRCNILNEIELLECNPWRQETIRELTEFYHLVRNEALEEAASFIERTDLKSLEQSPNYLRFSMSTISAYVAGIRAMKENKCLPESQFKNQLIHEIVQERGK